MKSFYDNYFPNESDDYRSARNALLEKEVALRKQIEEVAAQRRALPLGGELKEDYVFIDVKSNAEIPFSSLLSPERPSLIVYSFMYRPNAEKPCPSCNSIADAFNGSAIHVQDRVNLVLVAKAPASTLRDWQTDRGWHNLNLLSSFNNSYNRDYFAENPEGAQIPILNVFTLKDGRIYHTYATELVFAKSDVGDPRHVDSMWPLWNLLDVTPEGRGADWYPKLSYK